MKKLTLLSALIIFVASAFTSVKVKQQATELPVKTICIKNPTADNTTAFFTGATTYIFEVYKPGTAADIAKIKTAMEKDPNVQSFDAGAITGDYHAYTLTLKSAKNKEWFIKAFRSAGLNNIRINRNAVVPVEKM